MNQDDVKFRRERFERAQKGGQIGAAIAQAADMRDFARKLAGKAKSGRRVFHPAPHGRLRGSAVEGGIDLDRGKIMGIKLQPAGRRQVRRIKGSPPFLKTPGASAEPDFLLCREIQWTFCRIIAFHLVRKLSRDPRRCGSETGPICLPWPT